MWNYWNLKNRVFVLVFHCGHRMFFYHRWLATECHFEKGGLRTCHVSGGGLSERCWLFLVGSDHIYVEIQQLSISVYGIKYRCSWKQLSSWTADPECVNEGLSYCLFLIKFVVYLLSIVRTPPLYNGGFDFSKLMEMGGSKIFC